MVEVLACNDISENRKLFASARVSMGENSLCIRAVCGEEVLGFCLFEILGTTETLLYVEPVGDALLADGLIRSALHIGTERGITEAFYGDLVNEELLKKINFVENGAEKRLRLQNLFSSCQCSSNNK